MSMKGNKQLMKQYPNLIGSWDSSTAAWSITSKTSWTQYKSGDSTFFYQSGYFDLTGMKLEDLTIQLQGVAVQRPFEPVIGGLGGEVWDMPVQLNCWITSKPFADFERQMRRAALGYYPSFDGADVLSEGHGTDWSNLVFAETTTYSSNSNVGLTGHGYMAPLYTKLYGSNEASANEKLYVYVFWRVAADILVPAGSCWLPELRIAVAAEIYAEKELAYIERMRRSYVQS